MKSERRDRTERLLGASACKRLSEASVLICGLGGVGGYALEAVARAGVGKLWLVDSDTVSESNCNRQILALTETIGRDKTEVAAERVRSINPDAEIHPIKLFISESSAGELLRLAKPDYIIDAIDTVSAKLALISEAKLLGIPIITSMGTGNKLDASRFVIGDISRSSVCPLARVMRTELRRRGIGGVIALWSTEEPRRVVADEENGRHSPASVSFVPSVAGLLIGGYAVRALIDSFENQHAKGNSDSEELQMP